ncbi:MAG TPA: hypothetical protein VKJ07_03755, partial [Mycobacteriales bacterium]|nr:hypothetical protein [Mycobacteriales bacterium]
LFLDSDDVLPRRAAARLHSAATRADADVTCGRMVRRHHHPRRHLSSNDDLYRRADVLEGVLARPAQLRDTPACGKLFRREFLDAHGLRFPERLLFEDLLFTTTAYAAARRVAIVPALCYVWNVRRQQEEPSITNRRELRNWRDRFEIHRRIDADLAARPRPDELQAAKDHKFLTVDWPIYLRELRGFPADQRDDLLDLAAGYVAERPLHDRGDLDPGLRVACYLAGCRDLEATLTAADYVTTGGIGTDLSVVAGRVYWTRAHLDEPDANEALDVTDIGILAVDFSRTPFLAVVGEAKVECGRLTLRGRIHDVLERLSAAELTATLRVSGRFGGRVVDFPAVISADADGAAFAVEVDLRRLSRRLHPGVGHELRLDLVLGHGGDTSRVRLTARDAVLPSETVDVSNPWSVLLGRTATVLERNGRLVLDLPSLHPVVDGALDLATRVRNLARGAFGAVKPFATKRR